MQKQFSVLPDQAELEALARDLRFYPTKNPSPKAFDHRASRAIQSVWICRAATDL